MMLQPSISIYHLPHKSQPSFTNLRFAVSSFRYISGRFDWSNWFHESEMTANGFIHRSGYIPVHVGGMRLGCGADKRAIGRKSRYEQQRAPLQWEVYPKTQGLNIGVEISLAGFHPSACWLVIGSRARERKNINLRMLTILTQWNRLATGRERDQSHETVKQSYEDALIWSIE